MYQGLHNAINAAYVSCPARRDACKSVAKLQPLDADQHAIARHLVPDPGQVWDFPGPANDHAAETWSSPIKRTRYDGWSLDKIIPVIGGHTLTLLRRGTWGALIARREWGGLLVAATKLVSSYQEQVNLFRRIARPGLRRSPTSHEGMGLLGTHRPDAARPRGILPQTRRAVRRSGLSPLPGVDRHRHSADPPYEPPPPPPQPPPLPDDVAALTAIIKDLEQKNRLERADKARLLVELDLARDELREVAFNREDEQTKGIMGKFTGWLRRRRPLPAPRPERLVHGRGAQWPLSRTDRDRPQHL